MLIDEFGGIEMTSREKIIRLMELKRDYLADYNISINYFNGGDKEAIECWGDGVCEVVWGQLEVVLSMVLYGGSDEGNILGDFHLCPFCLKQKFHLKGEYNRGDCKDCEYGVNHGICPEDGSDYFELVDNLLDLHENDSLIGVIFFDNVIEYYEKAFIDLLTGDCHGD